MFSQLALFLLLCIKNKDCFNGAVQTRWAAFVQGNIFLLPHMHKSAHNTHNRGGLVQTVLMCGLICYSLLDRCKMQRGKVLIFCQYGCVLILGPHSFSSLRYREEEAEKCHTCFASLHDNGDHPSQRRSGC